MKGDLPSWITTAEAYVPPADRDRFVDRSIAAFLSVLARLRPADAWGPGTSGSPALRLASAFVFVLLLSLSRSPGFLLLCGAALLTLLAWQRPRQILGVLTVSLSAAAFTFAVLLPSAIVGSTSPLLFTTTKVFLSVAAVRLATTGLGRPGIAAALKAFFVPDLFVLVLDATLRYVVLLGELSLAMLQALKLRSVGRNHSKAASLGGIAGTLFLKSREVALDMQAAMECRCFTGEYRSPRRSHLTLSDFVIASIGLALACAFFLV